jgi:VIT1/CCC1 family predicted Fe2+/Mn2+ transporter
MHFGIWMVGLFSLGIVMMAVCYLFMNACEKI